MFDNNPDDFRFGTEICNGRLGSPIFLPLDRLASLKGVRVKPQIGHDRVGTEGLSLPGNHSECGIPTIHDKRISARHDEPITGSNNESITNILEAVNHGSIPVSDSSGQPRRKNGVCEYTPRQLRRRGTSDVRGVYASAANLELRDDPREADVCQIRQTEPTAGDRGEARNHPAIVLRYRTIPDPRVGREVVLCFGDRLPPLTVGASLDTQATRHAAREAWPQIHFGYLTNSSQIDLKPHPVSLRSE
jgi:hypothetical protein